MTHIDKGASNKSANHWTTPNTLYEEDMYRRSKRFRMDDEEVQKKMDNENYLYSNGWQRASISGYKYWTHPQYAATFSTDEALKKCGEMRSKDWRQKYCEKSDEAEKLRVQLKNEQGEIETLKKTLFEYEVEIDSLEEELFNYTAEVDDLRELETMYQQTIKERDNKIHYLQVELDNYKMLMNENKNLEEDPEKAREIFEHSLRNAPEEDLRAFSDILDSYLADKVMEDTQDEIKPFERTTERATEESLGEYPLTGYEEQMAFSPTSNPETTLEAMKKQYDHSKEMCAEIEKLMQECEGLLDKVDPEWTLRCGTDTEDQVGSFDEELENFRQARKELEDVLEQARQIYTRGDNPFDEGEASHERFLSIINEPNENLKRAADKSTLNPSIRIEEIQQHLPPMDYFSTPYDDGSKDDVLDKISHLSAMYSRFGYGARGKEWSRGYYRGQMDARKNLTENKKETSEETKQIMSEFFDALNRELRFAETARKEIEQRKQYTHNIYKANLKLQKKLQHVRTFLSSWEDGDRLGKVDEGTLYDTFNDYLEGKYDPEGGRWL